MSSEKPTIEDELKKLKELLQDGTRRCRECADKKADREQEKDRRRAEAEEDRKEIKGGLQEIREMMRVSQESCESEFQQREQDWNDVLQAVQESGEARLADLKALFEEQEEIKRQHQGELLAVLDARARRL
ncbi:hypothetical protein VKT23_003874 [Stygiomarasmius scandens]|uniref:Uncharacterized protein n=1 Tax=Marasmiellus scandens TaxID=2682957 RepID=A0ABR1K1J7_9AGAR